METFWNTIAQYNMHTWMVQLAIVLAGMVLTAALFYKPARWVKLAMKLFMVFINAWIAVVYYMVYCEARDYNTILALFWGIMALVWFFDLCTGYTTFERTHKYGKLSFLLCLAPFIYPLVSLARGMHFPVMTFLVMPCTVAVFTIGLLLSFSKRVNIFIILFLCHWALIGLSKVYFFRIPEDLLLTASAFPALFIFFKQYIHSNAGKNTKPGPRVLKWLLFIMCCVIAVFFTAIVFREAGMA